MKILISGSRNWNDYDTMYTAIVGNKPTLIIEGGARGADAMAKKIAQQLDIPVKTFPADWAKFGRSAGMKRNQQMLDEGVPDIVLAFPHADSIGTRGMIRIAKAAGIPTFVYEG